MLTRVSRMGVLSCEQLAIVAGFLIMCGHFRIGFTQDNEDFTNIRLVNGTPGVSNSGRVEVLHTTGVWLTVCDVNYWGDNDGTVSCRQLGFPGYSRARRGSYFGEGTNNGSVGEIGCTGNEDRLGQCSHGPVNLATGCNGRAAGLICTTPGFLGCYNDRNNRVFSSRPYSADNMTVGLCLEHCRDLGARYAGLEASRDCYCGDEGTRIDKYGRRKDKDCKVSCAGNQDEVCGGGMRLSIYDLTLGYCSDPGVPEYGGREPPGSRDGFRYAARVAFYCSDGFQLVGAQMATCVLGDSPQDVEWDAPLPECRYIPVPSTPSPLSDEPADGLNTGIVAGAVVGAVLFVLLLLLIVVISRKRKHKLDKNANMSSETINTSPHEEPNGKRYATNPRLPNTNTEYQDLKPWLKEPERAYTPLQKPNDQRVLNEKKSNEAEIPEYMEFDDEPMEYTVPDTERNERSIGATKQPSSFSKRPFGTQQTGPRSTHERLSSPKTTDNEYSYAVNSTSTNENLNQNGNLEDSDYYTLPVFNC